MKRKHNGGGVAAALDRMIEIALGALPGPAPALRPVPVRRPIRRD
jgi:hypothetical protein